MRLFAEVVNCTIEKIKLKDKEAQETLCITALDADFPGQIYRLNIWGEFAALQKQIIKGVVLEIQFQKVKAANQYEPLPVINIHAEDVRFAKNAKEVLKELHAMVKEMSPGNNSPATESPLKLRA